MMWTRICGQKHSCCWVILRGEAIFSCWQCFYRQQMRQFIWILQRRDQRFIVIVAARGAERRWWQRQDNTWLAFTTAMLIGMHDCSIRRRRFSLFSRIIIANMCSCYQPRFHHVNTITFLCHTCMYLNASCNHFDLKAAFLSTFEVLFCCPRQQFDDC